VAAGGPRTHLLAAKRFLDSSFLFYDYSSIRFPLHSEYDTQASNGDVSGYTSIQYKMSHPVSRVAVLDIQSGHTTHSSTCPLKDSAQALS
jgi:hypothetical protein